MDSHKGDGIKEEKGVNLAEEEVEEKADKGELLIVRRVLIDFQRVEEDCKEDSLHFQYEKAIIPIP